MWELQLKKMIEAAYASEIKIKEIYNTDFDVEIKSDDSPVTKADKTADNLIREMLSKDFPDYGFLTEESRDTKERLSKENIIIVDPVDGTKEFVNRNGEFTTNIALCHNHEIVVGVINVPMKDVLYYAIKGQGAWRLEKGKDPVQIHVSSKRGTGLIALRSRSFFNEKESAMMEKHKDQITEVKVYGAALKFCKIAEGDAEIQYRFSSNTKEWDVAPGNLLVLEAGGVMVKPDLTTYSYNREDPYNRDGYILANCIENVLL